MRALYLSLKSNLRIKIKIKTDNKLQFIEVIDQLKTIPVIKFTKENGEKFYESSIFHLKSIYELANKKSYEVYVTDTLSQVYSRFLKRMAAIQKAKENTSFSSSLWTDDPNFKVLDYQAKAINVSLRARRFLIGDDMGLGKTLVAMGTICKAFEDGYKRAIIFCPSRIKYQWKNEILKFTKILEDDISIIDLHTDLPCPLGKTDRHFARRDPCRDCEREKKCKNEKHNTTCRVKRQLNEGRIVIMNYDLIDRTKEEILDAGFDIIIFDEATRFKNWQAAVTKAVIKIGKELPQDTIILPMSGTFIENKIEEIYPPLCLVNKGILGEFYNFKNNYLICDFWGKVTGIRNEKKLKKLIDPWIIRRSIDEVWTDRPPLIEVEKVCEMTKVQRKIYEDAKAGMLKELDNKSAEDKINMAEIGALLNYLIQICDGVEAMDPLIKESGKLDTLKEIVEEEIARRHKVLIFSFFANKVIPFLEREMSEYGKCLVITGKTNPELAEKYKQRFINSPDYKFLICSDSMSYGANLQIARYVINYDLPWNPAKIDQRIGRVYRKGQTKSVTVLNLVTTHSVEDLILEKIGFKRKIFDQFLGKSTVARNKSLSLDDMVAILRAK